jgi:hypothetical protein
MGRESIVVHNVLIGYDKKLLLFLLMEVNKLLMSNKVETFFIFIHELILKVYSTPHQQQQTYIRTCQGNLFDFSGFLLMQKVASVYFLDDAKKNISFQSLLF